MTGLPGRILAVDPGRVRIGVAISDPLGITAQGLPTIQAPNRAKSLEAIAAIVRERDVVEIVVGRPSASDGSATVMTAFAERYAADLETLTSLPVRFWDERMTTAAAERALVEADVRRSERAGLRDRLAAVLILQGFLERRSLESST
jgi:putative Holliday junction resolvase